MHIVAVENNQNDLEQLKQAVLAVFPDSSVSCFTDPLMAIKRCMELPPELVLCERDLKRLDGFALVKMLWQKYPSLRCILLAGNDDWRQDARNLMMGYLVKPATAEKIKAALHKQKGFEFLSI